MNANTNIDNLLNAVVDPSLGPPGSPIASGATAFGQGSNRGGPGLRQGGGQPEGANLWCGFFAKPTPCPSNVAPDATAGTGGDHWACTVHRVIQFGGGGGGSRLPTAPCVDW
jgi:hypothetical protein